MFEPGFFVLTSLSFTHTKDYFASSEAASSWLERGEREKFQVGQDTRLNYFLAVEGGLLAEESAVLLNNFSRQRRNGAGEGKK